MKEDIPKMSSCPVKTSLQCSIKQAVQRYDKRSKSWKKTGLFNAVTALAPLLFQERD